VTHNLALAKMADRIIELRDGKIYNPSEGQHS
jgi:ABC-type lipoprotein export system ATPase subunit